MSNSEQWRIRLRAAIDRTGKKQSFIAEEANVAPATLSKILTGAHRHPRFATIVEITHACGVSVGWLLEEPVRGIELTQDERVTLSAAGELLTEMLSRKEGHTA